MSARCRSSILKKISLTVVHSDDILVLGDLNVNLLEPQTPSSICLTTITESYSLTHLEKEPISIRISDRRSWIAYIYTTTVELVSNILVENMKNIIAEASKPLTDHCSITCELLVPNSSAVTRYKLLRNLQGIHMEYT